MEVTIKLNLSVESDKKKYEQFLDSSKNELELKQLKLDFKKVVSRLGEIYVESKSLMGVDISKLDEEVRYICKQVNGK